MVGPTKVSPSVGATMAEKRPPLPGGFWPTTTAVADVAFPSALVAVSVNTVVSATLTIVDSPLTAPTPLSMLRPVAFWTCQARRVWPPPAGKVAGVAENDRIAGTLAAGPTVTRALRVVVPSALEALSVNVVVSVTLV